MLAYEIYLFILVSLVLFVFVFYKFFLWLLSPIFWLVSYFKKWYYKVFSLNKIKKQVLEENVQENSELATTPTQVNPGINTGLKEKVDRLFLKVEVLKQKGDLDGLEKKLIEILALDENNIKALEMLSNLYINLGKEKKAFPLLKRLIQLDMANDSAIWNLAKIYLSLWEIDTAEILIKKAIDINPNNHRYYVTLADILYNKGALEEAIEAIKKVLQLRPNNVIYMDALATLYEEVWEDNKAKALWLEILELEPDYEKAREKLNR